jgi:NADPH-dependent 2,4-dienoyl-CoA reductase/sulfur reductase-like enzyme
MRRVVVIGNGITGVTAARYLRKRTRDEITIISDETPHFFSRPALMYVYMGHMKFRDTKPYEDGFWEKNRIGRIHDYVDHVDSAGRRLHLRKGETVSYDKLVIACGSVSNRFDWPGGDLKGVQGFYSCGDLEEMRRKSDVRLERAVIVGGGLIGIEMAEMLLSRDVPVTLLVREENFWNVVLPKEEALLVERHMKEYHVDLRLETEIQAILPDAAGRARAVATRQGETIPCQFVGLAVGVSPNVAFLEGSGIETDRGVLVDEHFETSRENVYAGGDCAQFREPPPGRRPVEQVWYTGRMHGEHIAANLSGDRRPYRPGVWFNSAKFFDVEYQTYGMVPNQLPEDQETLYWEHPGGKKSFRVNYRKADRGVTGFNLLGLRGRHSICERWISEGTAVEHVLENLGAVNFDPEFFEPFERHVVASFNRKNPNANIRLSTERGLFSRYMTSLFRRRREEQRAT